MPEQTKNEARNRVHQAVGMAVPTIPNRDRVAVARIRKTGARRRTLIRPPRNPKRTLPRMPPMLKAVTSCGASEGSWLADATLLGAQFVMK